MLRVNAEFLELLRRPHFPLDQLGPRRRQRADGAEDGCGAASPVLPAAEELEQPAALLRRRVRRVHPAGQPPRARVLLRVLLLVVRQVQVQQVLVPEALPPAHATADHAGLSRGLTRPIGAGRTACQPGGR